MLTTILDRVGLHADRVLISDASGACTGRELFFTADLLARKLGPIPDHDERIAVLASPGVAYVASMLAVWMRGAMFVPLCPEHPPAEMAYVLDDADAQAVIVDPRLASLLPATTRRVIDAPVAGAGAGPGENPRPMVSPTLGRPALMLYTSGTTGRPKGVVHTHASVASQVTCLVEAWEWRPEDRIPHFLPLHHAHGLVNKLLCPLWVGARCDMLGRFDAPTVFELLAATDFTVFMAVPTIYAKAISAWEAADGDTRARWSAACRRLRLMVSGSAALAVPVLERWREIAGHTLLERYGMTEIGMALSNPLHGERRPGFVGGPVPGMQVRVVNDDGAVLDDDDIVGELQVRGGNVFTEYWRRPEETAAAFTTDGWFRTGDQVARENGVYRITGRLSTDIIKSGGYKISALEIESVLTGHPAIAEVCVVGVPDDVWGERIGAAVVLRPGTTLTLDELRSWARTELAAYKLPTLLQCVESLPRNVMGKTLKPAVRDGFPR